MSEYFLFLPPIKGRPDPAGHRRSDWLRLLLGDPPSNHNRPGGGAEDRPANGRARRGPRRGKIPRRATGDHARFRYL